MGPPGGNNRSVKTDVDRLIMRTDTGELTRRGKMSNFALIAVGLITFFVPTIRFDPPIEGRQYWSVLDMVRRPDSTTDTEMPFPSAWVMVTTIPFGWAYVVYVVLLAGMGAVLLFPFRKLMIGIGVGGLACLFLSVGGGLGLVKLTTTPAFQSTQGGDLRILWASFGAVLAALTITAWTDTPT